MKKTLKFKLMSLFLAIMIIASVGVTCLTAFADTSVIRLSIFCYYKNTDGAGHAWLMIENSTPNYYDVGAYRISPYETITVGTWGNLSNNGVWYNVEAIGVNQNGLWTDRVSLTKDITEQNLQTISGYINNHDYWNISYNCTVFVKDIWNMIFNNDQVSCGWMVNLPEWLFNSIVGKSYKEYRKPVPNNTNSGYIDYGQFHSAYPADIPSNSSAYTLSNEKAGTIPVSSFPNMTINELIMAQLIQSDTTFGNFSFLANSDDK